MRLKATITAIGLAGALLSPMIATAGEPTLGATTTTAAVPTSSVPAGTGATTTSGAGGEFTLPRGYEMLVDDTNRITVGVPSTWTDRDTSTFSLDGAEAPRIIAATDIAVWEDTFDAPGVWFSAHPYTPDPQSLINRFGLTSGCAETITHDYNDGLFVGLWGQWTQCGQTRTPEWHLIVASPASQAFTAVVIVQLTGLQDQEAFDVALETFNTTATASFPTATAGPTSTGPTTTVAGQITTPGTTVPVTTPPTTADTTIPGTTGPATTGPATSGPVTTSPATSGPGTTAAPFGSAVIDSTNLLTVTVPGGWTDRNVESGRHDDGSNRPTLAASPDLEIYYESFGAPGVYMLALPPSTEPATVLANYTYSGACTDNGVTPFNDGRFVGSMQRFTSCGGTEARVVHVVARPIDNSFTLLLQVQLADTGDTILNQILSSFGVVPGATYSQPTAPPTGAAPAGAVPPELMTAPTTITLTTVGDDSDIFTVGVPSTWVETDTSSNLNDDGSDRPSLAAAPVLQQFNSSWTAPGMRVIAFPFNTDPSVLLSNLGLDHSCDEGDLQTFDNGTLAGPMQTWTNCGETTSRIVMLAVSPASQSVTLFIEVQLPDADDTPLQAILSSVQVR